MATGCFIWTELFDQYKTANSPCLAYVKNTSSQNNKKCGGKVKTESKTMEGCRGNGIDSKKNMGV